MFALMCRILKELKTFFFLFFVGKSTFRDFKKIFIQKLNQSLSIYFIIVIFNNRTSEKSRLVRILFCFISCFASKQENTTLQIFKFCLKVQKSLTFASTSPQLAIIYNNVCARCVISNTKER